MTYMSNVEGRDNWCNLSWRAEFNSFPVFLRVAVPNELGSQKFKKKRGEASPASLANETRLLGMRPRKLSPAGNLIG